MTDIERPWTVEEVAEAARVSIDCPKCGRPFVSDLALRHHRARVAACQPTLAEALWAKTDKSDDPNACWLWTGAKRGKGYGRLFWRGRTYMVSHVALEVAGRPLGPAQMRATTAITRHA